MVRIEKNILLCVTGGIAAYKAAALASKLTQAGANVKVMMTEGAQEFVTPLTFQSLTRHVVYTSTYDEKEAEKVAHVDVADWADLVIIAPATANIIGKLANGIADDMVTTTLLATLAPICLAPAMNVNMYAHPAVQNNMNVLAERGYRFIEAGEGYLACGWIGKGRMAEPEEIVEAIYHSDSHSQLFKNKNIIITAGPTREKIDAVRFFTNRSTGKMGYALAEEAAKMGADVTLVSGPVTLETPSNVKVVNIESAAEMYDEVLTLYEGADVVIKSAAVADYTPIQTYEGKMKKKTGHLSIEMERTQDILAELGERKKHQLLVGFAAESEDIETYAIDKLKRKNLDLIVANNITSSHAGFAVDTNEVLLVRGQGHSRALPLQSKKETAVEILKETATLLAGVNRT